MGGGRVNLKRLRLGRGTRAENGCRGGGLTRDRFAGDGRGRRAERDGPVRGGRLEPRRHGAGEPDHGRTDAERFGERGPHAPWPVRAGGPGHRPGHAGAARGRGRARPGGRAGQPAARVQERLVPGLCAGELAARRRGAAGAGHRPGRPGRADRVRRGGRQRQLPRGPADRRRHRLGTGRARRGRARGRGRLPSGRGGHGRRPPGPGDGARGRVHRRDGRQRRAAQVRRRRRVHRLPVRDRGSRPAGVHGECGRPGSRRGRQVRRRRADHGQRQNRPAAEKRQRVRLQTAVQVRTVDFCSDT